MPVTFAQARAIVRAEVATYWTGPGALVTSAQGWEDDTYWCVEAGAQEWLVAGDSRYRQADDSRHLVDKATGAYTWVQPLMDRRTWRPVTDAPTTRSR